jgi:hypothetical protein
LKIMIPPRAGHFSTLHLLASLQRQNSRLRRSNSCLCGRSAAGAGCKGTDFKSVPKSHARFRDTIFKLGKALELKLTGGCLGRWDRRWGGDRSGRGAAGDGGMNSVRVDQMIAGSGCRAGGKSELHRAGWSLTATGGDPKESATENIPPLPIGKR